MALSWSGETVELKDLIDYSRRFRIGLIAVTAAADSTLGEAADVVLLLPQAREACPHNLAPTTSSLMQLALGDALAVALLESRGFTALDFRELPSGRPARRHAQIRPRHHAHRRRGAARRRSAPRCRTRSSRCPRKGFGCVGITDARRQARRHHHRRRSAPPHARRSARPHGRRRHDARAEDGAARSARERGAGDAQLLEDHRADRGRRPASRSASCICTICCAPAWREHIASERRCRSHA